MTKNNGILIVTFGTLCDILSSFCVNYSRTYTKLPIHVLTNIPENLRHYMWKSIDNITFQYFPDMKDSDNRIIKTTMNKYTPFDNTLYLDADSIIQRPGIDSFFERIENSRILLNHLMTFRKNKPIPNLYMEAVNQFKIKSPLRVYNGALIGFKKSEISDSLFELWHNYWIEFGKRREMPCLAAAIRNSKITVTKLKSREFAPDAYDKKSIVQHNYFKDFFERIGLGYMIDLPKPPTANTDFKFTLWE